MANITESQVFRPGVYQLEITDWAYGGAPVLDQNGNNDPTPGATPGLANAQAKQLADRTAWLKRSLDYAKGGASGYIAVPIAGMSDISAFCTLTPGSPNNTLSFNTSGSDPLVISFSDGYDSFGPRTFYGFLTSIASLSLAENAGYLIVADHNTTTNSVTVISSPFYASKPYHIGFYEPIDTGNNQYWFDLSESRMKFKVSGNWTYVNRVPLLFVSTVTSSESVDSIYYRVDFDAVFGNKTNPVGQYGFFQQSSVNGWVLCDGSAISRTEYKTLFDLIGTTFGVGDGSTTFNVPDNTDISLTGSFVFIKY